MVSIYSWALAACFSIVHAATITCPYPIGIPNGGFETGKIAPWTLLSNSNPTTEMTIVSPGHRNSRHALRIDFVASNLTEWSLATSTTAKECYGYSYNISYAWNWRNYTGPEGNSDAYCRFSVATGYTNGAVSHYATRTPGWHTHSYIGVDVYSHCKNIASEYVVDVTCDSYEAGGEPIPAFHMLVDDLKIQAVPDAPPQPGMGGC